MYRRLSDVANDFETFHSQRAVPRYRLCILMPRADWDLASMIEVSSYRLLPSTRKNALRRQEEAAAVDN